MPAAVLHIGGSEWRRLHLPDASPCYKVPILRESTFRHDPAEVVIPEVRVLTLCFILRGEDDNGVLTYELDYATY